MTDAASGDVAAMRAEVNSMMAELEAKINAVPCDAVVLGTPVDLRRVLTLHHPAVRVRYDVQEIGHPTLAEVLPEPLVKKRPTMS